MKRILKNTLLLISIILIAQFSIAQEDCIPQPKKDRIVHDFANVIDETTERQLENQLVDFDVTTSTQIAIVTVKSLCGNDKVAFTQELAEAWGVGQKGLDNGIVVMVKPKYSNERGEVRIEVGYGLEGVLPDAIAKQIVENEMIPSFKQNDYSSGIAKAVTIIEEITKGEYTASTYSKKRKRKAKSFPIIPLFFVGFFIFIMLASTFSRARRYGARNNMGLWAALWLMGSMNSRHRGHYNNFTSGGGGFGGFGGGGGFGGFGGGSFGGGGAGGSW